MTAGNPRWGHRIGITAGVDKLGLNASGFNPIDSLVDATGTRLDSIAIIRDGANLTMNVSGASVTSAVAANPDFTTSNVFAIGRGFTDPLYALMAFAELVIVNRAITAGELASWHAYANAKYAVTIA